MKTRKSVWDGMFILQLPDGKGGFETKRVKNTLTVEGEQTQLELLACGLNAPAGFQILCAYGTVDRTLTYATIADEPTTEGYARGTVARNATDWPTRAVDADGYFSVTSKPVTFSATAGGAGWGPVNYVALVTTDATPRLIAFAEIDEITLAESLSFNAAYKMSFNLT